MHTTLLLLFICNWVLTVSCFYSGAKFFSINEYKYHTLQKNSFFLKNSNNDKADSDDSDSLPKSEIYNRVRENEKKRGTALGGIVLLLTLRLFFTPVEIRTLRICGHAYDQNSSSDIGGCTPSEEAFPKLIDAIKGPIVFPTDPSWGGVPDVFGGEKY